MLTTMTQIVAVLTVCLEPMGVDNPMIIRDNQMTSSTHLDNQHMASAGRLYNEFTGWAPMYAK